LAKFRHPELFLLEVLLEWVVLFISNQHPHRESTADYLTGSGALPTRLGGPASRKSNSSAVAGTFMATEQKEPHSAVPGIA
jgi:hypothetical protein